MQFFKPLFIEFGIVFIVVLSEFPVFQASFHRASNNTNIISLVGHSNTFKPLFIEPETNSKVALEEALSFQASFHRVKFYKGCEYVVKGYLSSLFSSRFKILSFNEFFEKLSSLFSSSYVHHRYSNFLYIYLSSLFSSSEIGVVVFPQELKKIFQASFHRDIKNAVTKLSEVLKAFKPLFIERTVLPLKFR